MLGFPAVEDRDRVPVAHPDHAPRHGPLRRTSAAGRRVRQTASRIERIADRALFEIKLYSIKRG